MPKDAKKNIDRYKIRGGDLNEFEFQKNQALVKESLLPGKAMGNEEKVRPFTGATATEPTATKSAAKKSIAKKAATKKAATKKAATKKLAAKKSAAKKSVAKKSATRKLSRKKRA